MPDRRRHRGAHPRDHALFGAEALARLRPSAEELSWLLDRGYPAAASLKLVGDRHALLQRQRQALARAVCAPGVARTRAARRLEPAALSGQVLWIDGFNVLTTLEVALSGGVVLLCNDGTARDIAGVHGTYRKVQETLPALERVGEALAGWGVAACRWLLDRPVSNSGRLRSAMQELAAARSYPWEVELDDDPDRVLAQREVVIATADGAVLDRCGAWVSLAREVVAARVPDAFRVELSDA